MLVTSLNTNLWMYMFSIKLFYPDFEANSSFTSVILICSPGVVVLLRGGDRLGYS